MIVFLSLLFAHPESVISSVDALVASSFPASIEAMTISVSMMIGGCSVRRGSVGELVPVVASCGAVELRNDAL